MEFFHSLIFFQTLNGDIFLNDTAELEQRVEDLEVAMVTVQDDMSELETDVSLIDGRLLNLETDVSLINQNLINFESDVSDNENAIFGKHWQIFNDHFTLRENGKVIGWRTFMG